MNILTHYKISSYLATFTIDYHRDIVREEIYGR